MTLKASKQEIIDKVGQTSMRLIFKYAGQNMIKVITALCLPSNWCAQYTLWGGCGNNSCMNLHENAALLQNQVAKANAFFVEGGKKMMSESPQKIEFHMKVGSKFHGSHICCHKAQLK